MSTMRAAFYTRQGEAAEVIRIGEQPRPEPGPGEVRVRLRTSGVNPSDWKMRRGGGGRALVAPLIVPHSDGAGVIDAVGDGVPTVRIGERVWTWNAQWRRAFGTAADYVALPSAQAVPLPAALGFAEGACLGIPAFTALHAVRLAECGPGQRVLVAGGAGSVGHYAIQFAKLRGAEVIASVSSARKAAHAIAAGADHIVDYREQDLGDSVQALTGGAGVDRVIEVDLANNAAHYPKLLKPGARVVVYGTTGLDAVLPAVVLMQKSAGLRFFTIYEIAPSEREACLRELLPLLEDELLLHTIGQLLPLEEIVRAHELVERGEVLGNVVLAID
ncbi:NADPH:quinone reductase [Variovorax sp.]|uniref:NADPH:quinone reductase n=1 Tax=Variovorax sp. TaxID=1871043 RepID=UPI0025E9DE60|nr:NADPH:quinone reductase [Variovorax sp.]